MTDLATYLAGLKAGDVVTVWSGRMCGTQTVTAVTPTRVITAVGKYRRTGDHMQLGDLVERKSQYGQPPHIMRPSDARAFRIAEIARELRKDLTLDTIPAMRAALDRAEAALREGEE